MPEEQPRGSGRAAESSSDSDPGFEGLLEFIKDARGFDFTGYKRSSLGRRIRKRMAEVGAESWDDYRDRLEIDADEFAALFNTILINVTGFMRDAGSWEYLDKEVLPEVIDKAGPDGEVRVWSAGCSSGEEPYSLAILLAEHLGFDEAVRRVKVYGTDIDEEALQQARTGKYSAKSLAGLADELRDKYFESNGVGYTFRTELRRRVIFGRHDITRDAPISRLHLLACRNTLMYFNVETQDRVIDRLHFALGDGGYLFLGKAEMLVADSGRFEMTSMRHRVFRSVLPSAGTTRHVPTIRLEPAAAPESRIAATRRQLRDYLVEATPYAAIGLDTEGDIIVATEAARLVFGVGTHDLGRPFRDHELSYRPIELRSVIEQARSGHRTIRLSGVERRRIDAEPEYFDIVVRPVQSDDGLPLGTTISFIDVTTQTRLQNELKRIREDLETAYEELQSTNEELETSNEELQSSIEELETTNEELQSTNEELETTNEELQSGNEELETMNEEMRIRSGELDDARSFFEGVLSSIGAGVVVLDGSMLVQGWNRGAGDLWGLRADEVQEQPFFALDLGLPTANLREPVQDCLTQRTATGPVALPAIDRRGRSFTCAVSCTPLEGTQEGGVVLLMERA